MRQLPTSYVGTSGSGLMILGLIMTFAVVGSGSADLTQSHSAKPVGKPPSKVAEAPSVATSSAAASSVEEADVTGDVFVDATSRSGLDFVHWNGMTGQLYFSETPGGGGVLFDMDNDGDLDLFAVQGHLLDPKAKISDAPTQPHHPLPLRDRLYRNDLKIGASSTLRFVDVTEASGLDARGYGMGAVAGDYDNDGWTDLYITNFGANELWRNLGDGRFQNVTASAGVGDKRWSVAAAFFDYDADGWLDLFVGNYLNFTIRSHRPCFGSSGARDYCGPSSYQPEPDRLFRNLGDGTFEDVTATSGVGRGSGGALGVVTGDFDSDGDLDFYVANDQMANHLWLNEGDGTFVEGALLAGAAVNVEGLPEASMGLDAGDVDGDGDEDLWMTHLNQETNTLYVNDGGGFFEDLSSAAGLDLPSFAVTGFGTRLLDYDNDGWLDVLVVNGAIKSIERLARAGDPFPLHQSDQLYRNVGAGRFEEVTAKAGAAFEHSAVSRGLTTGDVDNDGDIDAVIFDNNAAARLLLNQVGSHSHWLGLEPWEGAPPTLGPGRKGPGRDEVGRAALGAWVGVFVEGRPTLWRRVRGEGSYAAGHDPRLIFGLGDATPTKIRVEWLGGDIEEWTDLEMGRYHRLVRGTGSKAQPKSP